MRRAILFVLLALVLPAAAFASSVDLTSVDFTTGPSVAVSLPTSPGQMRTPLNVTVLGGTTRIAISGGSVSPDPCNAGVCTLTGGTVTVTPRGAPSDILFTDSLSGGTVTVTGTTAVIMATLAPFSGSPISLGSAGGIVKIVLHGINTGGTVTGSAQVAAIPEPGTLGLLGTGLFGLAGMMRRKLRLPT